MPAQAAQQTTTILDSACEVFASNEMVVKVKEPTAFRMGASCESTRSSPLIVFRN